jgi:outer membrane protein assembly factor BamB
MRTLTLLGLVSLSASLFAADWPGWRGPTRDGISAEKGLLAKWPEGGPKLLWKTNKAGAGLSSVAVVGGTGYTMGAFGDDEYALALDGKGSEIWKTKLGPVHDWRANSWSRGPHATPAVAGDHVYVLTSKGMLACLAKGDGKIVWQKDLPKEMNAQVNPVGGGIENYGWGYAWSPLIVDDKLLITPGGPDGLFALLDRVSGKVIWRSKDIKDQATYGSAAVGKVGGRDLAFYVTQNAFYAVDLKDGAKVFENKRDEDYPDVVCPTPVVVAGKVYFTVGYGGGSEVYEADGKSLKLVWEAKEIGSKQGGTVIVGKNVFGYHEERAWMCQNFEDGKVIWPLKRQRQSLKAGTIIAADGKLYVSDEEGKVGMLEATTKGYTVLGEFTLPEKSANRKPSMRVWTHPSLSDGKLYLRDQEWIFCYEVK